MCPCVRPYRPLSHCCEESCIPASCVQHPRTPYSVSRILCPMSCECPAPTFGRCSVLSSTGRGHDDRTNGEDGDGDGGTLPDCTRLPGVQFHPVSCNFPNRSPALARICAAGRGYFLTFPDFWQIICQLCQASCSFCCLQKSSSPIALWPDNRTCLALFFRFGTAQDSGFRTRDLRPVGARNL